MGYRTSLNLKVIISIVSFKQNMNLKIQILEGNTLMLRFHVGFEIELPLEESRLYINLFGEKLCYSHLQTGPVKSRRTQVEQNKRKLNEQSNTSSVDLDLIAKSEANGLTGMTNNYTYMCSCC